MTPIYRIRTIVKSHGPRKGSLLYSVNEHALDGSWRGHVATVGSRALADAIVAHREAAAALVADPTDDAVDAWLATSERLALAR